MDDQGTAANANPPGIASVVMPATFPAPLNPGDLITRPGQVPAYTLVDVRDWFIKYPYMAGRARPGTTVTLTRLAFLSRAEAQVALRRSPDHAAGLAPNDIVCYLEFSGTFDLSAISHPYVPGAPPIPDVHNSHLVLDATTGRAITWGFFPDNTMPGA